MKTLIIASMLFSGGSAVAIQNEDIADTVNETASQVMYKVQNMFKGNQVVNVKENGFPYPNEEYLSSLTEEQAFEIISAIDIINATYDWSNMTDEEIQVTLDLVKVELHDLYLELGIEGPMVQTQTRARKGNRNGGGERNPENFTPYGDGTQDGTCTDEDVDDSGDAA